MTTEFTKTPGWLDWYAGPSTPRFQVPPGSHELMVRFDFEVPTGGSFGGFGQTTDRTCFMTLQYDRFEAGQRYRLEGRSLGYNPNIRLYNKTGQLLAEERSVNCI